RPGDLQRAGGGRRPVLQPLDRQGRGSARGLVVAGGVPAVPGVGVEVQSAELVGGPVVTGLEDRDTADGVVVQEQAVAVGDLVAEGHRGAGRVGVALEQVDLPGCVELVPAVDVQAVDLDVLGVRQGEDAQRAAGGALDAGVGEPDVLHRRGRVGAVGGAHVLPVGGGVEDAGVVLGVLPVHAVVDDVGVR